MKSSSWNLLPILIVLYKLYCLLQIKIWWLNELKSAFETNEISKEFKFIFSCLWMFSFILLPCSSLYFNCSADIWYIAKSYIYFRSFQKVLPHMLDTLAFEIHYHWIGLPGPAVLLLTSKFAATWVHMIEAVFGSSSLFSEIHLCLVL